jgi:hypothetical protein
MLAFVASQLLNVVKLNSTADAFKSHLLSLLSFIVGLIDHYYKPLSQARKAREHFVLFTNSPEFRIFLYEVINLF